MRVLAFAAMRPPVGQNGVLPESERAFLGKERAVPQGSLTRLPSYPRPVHQNMHVKMHIGTRRLLTIAIVAILAVSVLPVALAQPADTARRRAEAMMKVAEKAQEVYTKAVDQAKTAGVSQSNLTAAANIAKEADALLAAARAALPNDPRAAADKAHDAAAKYRDAIRVLRAPLEKEKPEDKEGVESLRHAVERTSERLEELQKLVSRLPTTAENRALLAAIKGNLTAASNALKAATAALEKSPPDVKAAADAIGDAARAIGQIHSLIGRMGLIGVSKRLDNFFERAERDIQRVQEAFDRVKSRLPADVAASLQKRIDGVKGVVTEARKKAGAGDFDGALAALKQAAEALHDITRDLHSRGRR